MLLADNEVGNIPAHTYYWSVANWASIIMTQSLTVKKVKCSCYRPGVAQRVGRGIALLFHDRGTRRGWVVSSMPQPHFTPGKDPVPIVQEAGWAPGPVWTGRKSRPHWDSILDRPARSQSLYQLSYPAHQSLTVITHKYRRNLSSYWWWTLYSILILCRKVCTFSE